MKKKALILTVTLFVTALALTVFAAQPGTNDDPLVSKSYVDGKISDVMARITANGTGSGTTTAATTASTDDIVAEVVKRVEPLIALLIERGSAGESAPVPTDTYMPVFASKGQVVLGSEGTEMIVRSGRANVYITGVAGVVDATTGAELVQGNEAKRNHIIIIPRGDGRGVKITEDAWFIIKGTYQIEG